MPSHKLDLVHKAIKAGFWGNIQWKDSSARVMRENNQMAGLTTHGIRLALRDFVRAGNCLTVRNETRLEKLEEDPDDPFWYRAVICVEGFPHELFVEVKLVDDDPTEPFVQIVSAHP